MSDSITSLPQPRPSDSKATTSTDAESSGRGSSNATTGNHAPNRSPASSERASAPGENRSAIERIDVSSIDIDTLDEEALRRLPAGQQEAVKKLHKQVARAVTAIKALKAENRQLRERVQELEQRPAVPDGGTALTLPRDPDSLRETVDHFIGVIDAYLDGNAIPEEKSNDDASAAG